MIQITDTKILEFFERNPQMEPTSFIISMIDTYDYIFKTLNGHNADQILKHIMHVSTQVERSHMDYKLVYTKSMEDLKTAISNSQRDMSTRLLTDLLSSTKESMTSSNNRHYQELCKEIKYMISSIQTDNTSSQHIMNVISSSEARMTQMLNNALTQGSQAVITTQSLTTQMNSLLDKFNNSSQKGRLSENILSSVLSKAYPSAEVDDTRDVAHSCDIRLRRGGGKPDILFENKNYARNVNSDEVKKFLDDVKTHNSCGIMLSQQSGIVYKPDYNIEILNGMVCIYLHNVEYDVEKIKLAVQIIDHMQENLNRMGKDSSSEDDGVMIDPGTMLQINADYQDFIKKRESLISYLKESSADAILKVKSLEMPSIRLLVGTSSSERITKPLSVSFTCKTCKDFVCKTRKELCEHKRGCLHS